MDRLRPAPTLSPSQQRAAAVDFQMEGGVAEIPVRAAMLFNFVRRMRLDRGGQLIEIENTVEVEAAMGQIKALYYRIGEIN